MVNSVNGILKTAKETGFDDVAAYVTTSRSIYMKITQSTVDSVVEKKNFNCDLFLEKDKKLLILNNISDISNERIKKELNRGANIIKGLKPKEDYMGIAKAPFKKLKKTIGNDKAIENADVATLSDKANATINSALANGATNVTAMFVVGSSTSEYGTSNGFLHSDKDTFTRLSIRTFHDNFTYQDVFTSRKLNDIKFEQIGKKTAQMASSTKTVGKITDGKYDIIYMQSPGGALLTNVNSAACMTNAETGSIFTNKLHKEVANKNIRIYDDGTLKGGVSSSLYDGEGTPSQKTPVITDGILKNYLHNYSTAKKYKTKSTGNAGLLSPSTRTLVMEHDNKVKDIDKLISETKNGILITNSWYTRFSNYLTGDFSTMPRDLAIYIKNGQPMYTIKQKNIGVIVGIRITDNILRMLKNIDLVAKDERQAASWDVDDNFFVPSFMVRDATVTVV
jgi:PmbA protein